jgi:hypothetical protein
MKPLKLCGTMPGLEVLSWLRLPLAVGCCRLPGFYNIVSKNHQKLFAQRIAGRLGFKIMLQHKHVSLEVALNIFFYLSSDEV